MMTEKPNAKRMSRASKAPKPKANKSAKSGVISKPGAKVAKPAKPAAPSKPRMAKSSGASVAGSAKSHEQASGKAASRLIDQRIRELGDWRGETLAHLRSLILEADPEMIEEWKWMGTPVWSHNGIVTTGETYTKVVKLTFAQGAKIPDPSHLFNSSLEGNMRRAIDIHEGEKINEAAFKALVKVAVAYNGLSKKAKPAAKESKPGTKKAKQGASKAKPVQLLSGGNPQIAKADGNAPVQEYLDAIPDWKRDVAKRLDAIIVQTVPDVRKAIKWNSPFYGIEGQGWFLNFHCFTKYLKMAFFRGTSLNPLPPGESKSPDVRYLDIHENDQLDEAQLAAWAKQAAALPGWAP